MDREIRKLNDTLVNIFNTVMKMEEEAIQKASYDDISITEVHTLEAIGTGRARTMTHVANILGRQTHGKDQSVRAGSQGGTGA